MRWDHPIIRKVSGRLARPPRELVTFFATSVAARTIGIACQVAQVPIVLHSLGGEAFGFWMAIMGLTSFVTFADFGLGVGVQNRVSESLANGRVDEARELFSTAFLFLSAVALVLAGGLGLMITQVDLTTTFHLEDPATVASAPGAALTMVLIFCTGFPFALAQRLAFGRQAGWMINVSLAVGSLAALGSVALGAALGWGLGAMVAAAQGALVLANVVLLAVQLIQLGWLNAGLARFRAARLHEMLGLGVHFSVQQILTAVLFALPQIVISTTLGAAAVTPYNLAQRLFNLFAVIQNAFMLPLWPAYSRAKARGDFAWMRRTLGHSIRATLAFSIAPMALGAAFSDVIIRLWVGQAAALPATTLVWLLFFWNAAVFLQQPFGYLLTGVSEVPRLTTFFILSAGASAGLMFWLAGVFGAEGVVLGLVLGYLPFGFSGSVFETLRYLRENLPLGDLAHLARRHVVEEVKA